MTISGSEEQAKLVAQEVAAWGDWSFDSLNGWRNHIPDLWPRVSELAARDSAVQQTSGTEDEELARKVAEARERAKSRSRVGRRPERRRET